MRLDLPPAARLGAARLSDGRCEFCLWAPRAEKVDVELVAPRREVFPLTRVAAGYHHGYVGRVAPGSRYFYLLDGANERPDPASRFQPDGVHGPSEIIDDEFPWTDHGWSGIALGQLVIYELHVGAYTRAGTFDALIEHLPELKELGINAVELMPVAQFPGERNWGYDGVYPFAAQNSYGGPQGLKRLVDASHRHGLAVILDVVYNHLGPEGNYLADFAPYFTERYKTPWGPALNFDGPYSDEVRRFFIENARHWIADFHIDALRLDAVHAILDCSPQPFLAELAAEVKNLAAGLNRRVYLIPESAANDARLIRPPDCGGYGLDAVWSDDFHHSLRTLLTGERRGYYEDYGRLDHLARAYRDGFTYSGEYSSFRQRRHGSPVRDMPPKRFVVFSQNHDQVGNHMRGDRLGESVSLEALKLAAATVILSPYIPLIFMGEEYAETAPFPYFVSHSDPALIEAVRQGRREEFASFNWQGEVPDPQAEETFLSAKLRHHTAAEGRHHLLRDFYKELLEIRKSVPALGAPSKQRMEVIGYEKEKILFVRRWNNGERAVFIANFGAEETSLALPVPAGLWRKRLDSADPKWAGGGDVPERLASSGAAAVPLKPHSAVLLTSSI